MNRGRLMVQLALNKSRIETHPTTTVTISDGEVPENLAHQNDCQFNNESEFHEMKQSEQPKQYTTLTNVQDSVDNSRVFGGAIDNFTIHSVEKNIDLDYNITADQVLCTDRVVEISHNNESDPNMILKSNQVITPNDVDTEDISMNSDENHLQGSDRDYDYAEMDAESDDNADEKTVSGSDEEEEYQANRESGLENLTVEVNHEEDGRKKKRKSKGQGDSSKWKRKRNAQARLQGDAYVEFSKDDSGKYKQIAPKRSRQLNPRCEGHNIASKGPQQKFECASISEEERELIFKYFWRLKTWTERKIYLNGLVMHAEPKHRRRGIVRAESRKQIGFKYFPNSQTNGNEVRKYYICKKMFLATLGVGEKSVRSWVLMNSKSEAEESNKSIETNQQSECLKNVKDFLNGLPKIESHYCRSSSRKLYLEPIWNSYRHLHREFLSYSERENKRSCSWKFFLKTFKSMNLEIYTPRKDQCNTCTMFKKGNLNQTEYDRHIERKEQAREKKQHDKESTNSNIAENQVNVYTMDLQAVLLCPYTQASAMYYKQKLKVHYMTYYNLHNKEVSCLLWHEGNGGLESDVFVSNTIRFLRGEMEKYHPSLIILWSDGCCYQNRNVNMSNALLELAIEKNITIEQKYLEVGHTQMEVDSIHSVIERKLGRRTDVSVPADYAKIIKSARQSPTPYKVLSLTYKDFFKYSDGIYSSIRPGNKKGDPCVRDICALRYIPQEIIKYKLKFADSWKELPRRPSKKYTPNHEPLYSSPRLIDENKFMHLQELKSVIEPDYHDFYNKLKHRCTSMEQCNHIKP